MIKTSSLTLEDFSGGLNTKTGSMQVPVNYSPNCLNVHSNLFKTLQARQGMSKLNTNATGETKGNGLFVFPYWSGGSLTEELIGFFDDKMYKMDSLDGAYDSVTLAAAQSNDTFEATVYSNATQNFLLFANQSMDTPQVYNTTCVSINTATLDSTKHMISWKRHIWCGYTKESSVEYPYRLRRTNLSTFGIAATDWTAGTAGYDDIVTNDGDYITGFSTLRGYLYVFKRNSIFRVSYLGGSPLVEIRQVASVGTQSPRSIKNITLINGDEILIFWGTDNRIYLFNGYNSPQPISELISEDNGYSAYSLPKVNKNKLDIIHAENYDKRHWYVVFFPLGTSTTVNAAYIIDYYTVPFSIWAVSGWSMHSCVIAKDSLGNRNLYASNYEGRTFKLDTGNTDDSSAINAFYEFPKLKISKAPYMKKPQQVQTILKAIGDYELTQGYRTNFLNTWQNSTIDESGGGYLLGTTFTLGTATLGGTEGLTHVRDIPLVYNFLQLKYSDNSTNPRFQIYQIDFLSDAEGFAKTT